MRTHRYHRVSVSLGYSIGMFDCSCQLCAGIRAHENVAMYGMLIVKVQEMKDYVLEQSIRIRIQKQIACYIARLPIKILVADHF